ncbi:MAG TPA: Gfo/Idh/MocA family oxidoreductase, partial [Chthonomonadales bacterium]|nr:Gfo/Idh/MocA family oxidoreductase [Chthonomonadales bacterium]
MSKLRIGLVGAAGRGGAFRAALEDYGAEIAAVCDTDASKLHAAARDLRAPQQYRDYSEMLDRCALDAVLIGTPQHLHAPQCISALERGLHVLSEVPAAISLDQSKSLAAACAKNHGLYMMAENYVFTRQNILLRELAARGLFGDVYYAEGEYLHDVRDLAERTPWRRHWQLGIDGITYPTHSLGPILQWMHGDRVARACCAGSGSHYVDRRGEPYHQDTAVMLCETERGALIKIRTDLVSNRPHAMTNYQLQGTRGAYESARASTETDRIWLDELGPEAAWHDLRSVEESYLPQEWRNPPAAAVRAG